MDSSPSCNDADTNKLGAQLPVEMIDSPINDAIPSESTLLDTAGNAEPSSELSAEPFFPGRELRPLRDHKRKLPSAWLDKDDTGDFDPDEERRKSKPRKRKIKLSSRQCVDTESCHTEATSTDVNKETQPRPIVCLSFTTASGKAAFGELCAAHLQQQTLSRDDFTEGYRLRTRKRTRDGNVWEAASSQKPGVRIIANESPADLSNQPAARGCYGCASVGEKCSLLDNEHRWPCDTCKEGGEDCYLITVSLLPPARRCSALTLLPGTPSETVLHALSVSRQKAERARVFIRIHK